MRGVGCLQLTGLLTWCLASLPEDLKITTLAPDGHSSPIEEEPFFLKVTSSAVLGVCPEKLCWLLRIC